jgi:aldose 1-epimerase
VVGLYARREGGWLPIMRETPAEAVASGLTSRFSSFTLAPWSNRIRDARFTFARGEHQLRPTNPEGTAQHGDVRNRPWRVAETSGRSLRCQIDSRDFPDSNFPFPYTASVEYSLEGDACDTTLSLTNVGNEPMPGGFGLHPYFVRDLSGAGDALLCFEASGVYLTGEDRIPDGASVAIPSDLDFGGPRLIGAQALDHAFSGWAGSASLEWEGSGLRLVIRADEVFSHLIIFTAPDGTLAIEPVTHATDAFNLAARGVHGTGMRVLEPGQSISGRVSLTLEGA